MVLDPTLLEEQVRTGQMVVTMNTHRELCALSKTGGVPLEMDQVLRCCDIAFARVTAITEQIQTVLKEDEQRREAKLGGGHLRGKK